MTDITADTDKLSSSEERFDIYDEDGNHLGTAARSEVHARGLWHRSFHCWLIRREAFCLDDGACADTAAGQWLVLFQLRHPDKDTFPGCCDITAAGHLTAGESVRDAVREVEEELGVAVAYEELLPLGEVRMEKAGEVKGVPFTDREVSDVFGLVYEGRLEQLKLQRDEVSGVFEAPLVTMIELFEGKRGSVEAAGVEADSAGINRPAVRTVRAEQFVPRPADYYSGLFRDLLAHAAASSRL